MLLNELLRLIPLQTVSGSTEIEVRGVALDSREVEPGAVFVAIVGERTDGHRFLEEARRRGAVAVVSEKAPPSKSAEGLTWVQTPEPRKAAGLLAARAYGHPSRKLELAGITGTNGKTTCCFLLDGVFGRLAPPSVMLGTVVRRLGDESWPTRQTTPEAPSLQAFLADAVTAGCRYGALEVSSHGLALHRMEGMELAAALFTNLSRDHLDFHTDMEEYFRTKKLLFEKYLKPDGRAVICIDDDYGVRLASRLDQRVTTYGRSPDADIRIEEVEASISGTRLRFRDRGGSHELVSPLIGGYNAVNLVGSYAVARSLGFDPDDVIRALGDISGAPGRFERVLVPGSYEVVVDYAHTDAALRNLLEAARELTEGELWVVFGCGGERDRSKRPLMGDVAARLAQKVVITSDNPRGEDPMSIIREIEQGARNGRAEVNVEPDRRKAIGLALNRAAPGDLVVVAGKGHEPYQIVGTGVLDFDDREVVRELAEAETAHRELEGSP